MRILSAISVAAYFATPNLLPIVIFKGVNLSIKYGNTELSAMMYASYGLILCGKLGNIKSGYRFGNLALELLERFNASKIRAKVAYIVNGFVKHWQEHTRQTLPFLLEDYTIGIETGDLQFASYSGFIYSFYSYFVGQKLAFVEQEIAKYSEVIQKCKQELHSQSISLISFCFIVATLQLLKLANVKTWQSKI